MTQHTDNPAGWWLVFVPIGCICVLALYTNYFSARNDAQQVRAFIDANTLDEVLPLIRVFERKTLFESRLNCALVSIRGNSSQGEQLRAEIKNKYNECYASWRDLPEQLRGEYYWYLAANERSTSAKAGYLDRAASHSKRGRHWHNYTHALLELAHIYSTLADNQQARETYVLVAEALAA